MRARSPSPAAVGGLRRMRRRLLQWAAASLAMLVGASTAGPARGAAASPSPVSQRARPGTPGWPDDGQWASLRAQVGDALMAVRSPWAACTAGDAGACDALRTTLRNPYAIGDEAGLTQSLGWVGAWTSQPSRYAVAARSAADVAAAVDFARTHGLRLVVKGGGHSYKGQSCAPDSLLVWTRRLRAIELHDAFVPDGAPAGQAPQRAVSLGAGVLWGEAYDAVTTQAGGYVQGGGCLSVGTAGLVLSGGFGSFSKAFGLACASLLQAEVVTADGQVRTVNAQRDAELFWALKGGGGGSLAIVTRLTLRVHALPARFGAVNFTVQARSDAAFRRLIGLLMDLAHENLLSPHWGEQIRLRRDNSAVVSMVFQGLERRQAVAVWQPLLDRIADTPEDFRTAFAPFKIITTGTRDFWSLTPMKRLLGFMGQDPRPGAPATNVFWQGDLAQAGQVFQAYQSAWLPAALLQPQRRAALADALFAASRHWGVSLHFNKGLAGAGAEVLDAARDTAVHPAVRDAFALAISAAEAPPSHPELPGDGPDLAQARARAEAVAQAMAHLRALAPGTGSYWSESDFFQPDWQQAFWGPHAARLRAVKARYDPESLFTVHHGIGSDAWSADGFTRRG